MKRALLALTVWLAGCAPAPTPLPDAVPAEARRIVTLAPHLAELVFSAGAGDRLVGVVEFTDYPAAAAQLPRIGDAFRVDEEVLLALKPDLVLGWTSGNPPPAIERLRRLGLRVVTFEPTVLADVADHIEAIGVLTGTGNIAATAAANYRRRLAELSQPGERTPLRVFVQLAAKPYYTVTDRHFLGQGLKLCGGLNVFGELPGLAPVVSLEAVIAARPEVIIASDMGSAGPPPLAGWSNWRDVPAVANGNTWLVDADLLSRPSTRILDGVAELCSLLGKARVPARSPQSSAGSSPGNSTDV